MAGAMRKVAVYLGLVEDREQYDESYDDGPYDGEYDDAQDRQASSSRAAEVDDRSERGSQANVAPFPGRRTPVHVVGGTDVTAEAPRITTLHPRTYNDARLVGEHYRDGSPVIMNLTGMDDSDAKRLVDFAAGLIFGVHGSIDRITTKVFLLTPPNVTVRAEDKERIAEGGFFNQS